MVTMTTSLFREIYTELKFDASSIRFRDIVSQTLPLHAKLPFPLKTHCKTKRIVILSTGREMVEGVPLSRYSSICW